MTTPKSDKVKRNLSDRVVTPGKGGKKEVIDCLKNITISEPVTTSNAQNLSFKFDIFSFQTTPYIKTALLSDGKKRTPNKKPAGISQHSRLHQIINQEISSISSKRSNNIKYVPCDFLRCRSHRFLQFRHRCCWSCKI